MTPNEDGMVPVPAPGEVDLSELEAFLSSDRAPEGCMPLSLLDGYLTAIAIGPETILPGQWLDLIWGEAEPEFVDLEEAHRLIAAILGRYNEILTLVRDEPDLYEPIVEVDEEGAEHAAGWAHGFMEGVGLVPGTWEALILDGEESLLLAPIFAHLEMPAGEEPLVEGVEALAELRRTPSDYIIAAVIGIDAYWRSRRHKPRRVKIGRNDPCPCGSGRKHKRCCGR